MRCGWERGKFQWWVVGRVVDHDLRVIGINSLRVVDGSVFGVSPGTNPQATVMMLGRYVYVF
jgi:mandelonitrile lyase